MKCTCQRPLFIISLYINTRSKNFVPVFTKITRIDYWVTTSITGYKTFNDLLCSLSSYEYRNLITTSISMTKKGHRKTRAMYNINIRCSCLLTGLNILFSNISYVAGTLQT